MLTGEERGLTGTIRLIRLKLATLNYRQQPTTMKGAFGSLLQEIRKPAVDA